MSELAQSGCLHRPDHASGRQPLASGAIDSPSNHYLVSIGDTRLGGLVPAIKVGIQRFDVSRRRKEDVFATNCDFLLQTHFQLFVIVLLTLEGGHQKSPSRSHPSHRLLYRPQLRQPSMNQGDAQLERFSHDLSRMLPPLSDRSAVRPEAHHSPAALHDAIRVLQRSAGMKIGNRSALISPVTLSTSAEGGAHSGAYLLLLQKRRQ